MAKTIRTSDGDRLDTICYRYYGHLNGTVEAVFEANPGLADRPQPFVSGIEFLLPDIAPPVTKEINLWS